MNPTARIFLLFGAVVLLVFGVVCLKQRIGQSPAPPAFVPGSDEEASRFRKQPADQPTILAAEQGTEHEVANHSNLREVNPLRLNDDSLPPLDVPIKTTAPELPRYRPAQPIEAAPPVNSNNDVTDDRAAAILHPPVGIASDSADEPAEVPPTSVVTVSNDSLWLISQRVYGRGDYYKALFLHNRAAVERPDRLAAGIEISTPNVAQLQQLFPDACPVLVANSN